MRVLLALGACAVVCWSCEDDAPPILVPRDAGTDASVDAAADATPDAAPDAALAPAGETCTGPIDIRASFNPEEDGAYHIAGNLDDFADDIAGCGGFPNDDADAVYVFVPPADGQIRTTLGNDAYADLGIGPVCDDAETQLSCVGYPGFGCSVEPCGHLDPVSAGEPIYLVVDGKRTTAREYVLTLQHYTWMAEGDECADDDLARTCAPPMLCREEAGGTRRCRVMRCGDGIVEGDPFGEGGEMCDDGNAQDGDGCSATCAFEEQGPGGDDCAGAAPFVLVPTNPGLFVVPYGTAASDTSAASADLAASCAETTMSPDEVWRLELPDPTPLTMVVASQTEGYLPVATVLGDDGAGGCGTEVACGVSTPDQAITFAFDPLPAGTYFIVVDGIDGEAITSGGYSIEALATVF